jgi:hypothetical protein
LSVVAFSTSKALATEVAKLDHQSEFLLVAPPPKRSAQLMRPLWRDLILQVWGGDLLKCPCCAGTMKVMRPILRREEVKFFLQLHGLWEGLVCLPRPPPPPFDIESLRRIEPPWTAIKEWIAAAPLWPCSQQDPPPDLVIMIRRPRAAIAFPMTNPTSIGSTVPESPMSLPGIGSTKARYGNPRKSNWTTVASWCSNTPDKQAKNRCQKRSWQGGLESYAPDQ